MSEGFRLLRLHDSSLTPVRNARCTLAISPMASSAAYVNRGNESLGEPAALLFRLLKWMFLPTTVSCLGHQPTSSGRCAEDFCMALQQHLLRRCLATENPCSTYRP